MEISLYSCGVARETLTQATKPHLGYKRKILPTLPLHTFIIEVTSLEPGPVGQDERTIPISFLDGVYFKGLGAPSNPHHFICVPQLVVLCYGNTCMCGIRRLDIIVVVCVHTLVLSPLIPLPPTRSSIYSFLPLTFSLSCPLCSHVHVSSYSRESGVTNDTTIVQ